MKAIVIAVLVTAGIAVEVIPGVSSAIAVPAAAGIPLTHRRLAASFAVATGHECAGANGARVDWAHLAGAVDTLVILMGLANLPRIVREMVAAGRPPHTPVAVVQDGTTRGQVTITGTLADIGSRVASAGLRAPAVIVVGDVVTLRDQLGWTDGFSRRGRPSRRRPVAAGTLAIRASIAAKEEAR